MQAFVVLDLTMSPLSPLTISVVVPVVDEAARVGACVAALRAGQEAVNADPLVRVGEIVVVDGGSSDATVEVARAGGARVVASAVRGRAAQMNAGAAATRGDVLYFVHGDAVVPPAYARDIARALAPGDAVGGYRVRFDRRRSPLLRVNEWMTRFAWPVCRGGDQTLFVPRALFDALGGYDERRVIMEEYDFLDRARRHVRYRVLDGVAVVSARKYVTNTWWQVQRANAAAYRAYRRGAAPEAIERGYRSDLNAYT